MAPHPSRYTGKVALVSGGGTGIGAAIAARLAAEGARVAICGRRAAPLRARVQAWQAAGCVALAIPGDVSTDAAAIVGEVLAAWGRLDVLVNNAAISSGLALEEMGPEQWRSVLAVNLDGAFALASAALPALVASRGVFLHISSISAFTGELDDAAYAASKAGLEALSRKLALELAPQGVRSNVIRPGLIVTEAFEAMPPAFFDSQLRMIPLRRLGAPEDIAHAAAFLCSDEAAFITGTVLTIDGGESAE